MVREKTGSCKQKHLLEISRLKQIKYAFCIYVKCLVMLTLIFQCCEGKKWLCWYYTGPLLADVTKEQEINFSIIIFQSHFSLSNAILIRNLTQMQRRQSQNAIQLCDVVTAEIYFGQLKNYKMTYVILLPTQIAVKVLYKCKTVCRWDIEPFLL